MKQCSICRVMKPAADFYINRRPGRPYETIFKNCKTCHNQRSIRWAYSDPIRLITAHLFNRYKLSFRRRHYGDLVEGLRQLWDASDKICPYTGRPLVFGDNVHLDHKKPVSRYPELKIELSNLQWVHEKYNRSKQDMTDEEFLEFCKLIVTQAQKRNEAT